MDPNDEDDPSGAAYVRLHLTREVLNPSEPPTLASKFNFIGVGAEIHLEVGHLDLVELRDFVNRSTAAAAASEPPYDGSVTMHVTNRFFVTPEAAKDLLRIAREMVAHLVKVGVIKEDAENAPGDGSSGGGDFL